MVFIANFFAPSKSEDSFETPNPRGNVEFTPKEPGNWIKMSFENAHMLFSLNEAHVKACKYSRWVLSVIGCLNFECSAEMLRGPTK